MSLSFPFVILPPSICGYLPTVPTTPQQPSPNYLFDISYLIEALYTLDQNIPLKTTHIYPFTS